MVIVVLFLYLQAPDDESHPSVTVELFVSTERIMILNSNLEVSCYIYLFRNVISVEFYLCWKSIVNLHRPKSLGTCVTYSQVLPTLTLNDGCCRIRLEGS